MAAPGEYVVVARRYRPQSFQELVGQQQAAHGLAHAIETNRVGHAYLFTGARGVGKTSTARIFAKALNCERGPTPRPCNVCDICRGVTVGDDMDVLEIDGASNRGIDEIRELRSNVNVRPSRARFKIYIIDEVHMLTTPAFNALLKTLEEPPEHVKFIFCTTDPEKIPITVLSRCQRFDFPPVESRSIVERLRQIVDAEGMSAEDEALQLLARRANGSLRDSQSLLEQLLAYGDGVIHVHDVHTLLGTAQSGRLAALVRCVTARDARGAFAEVEQAIGEGADVGQLAEQLVGYLRDMIAAVVGCAPDTLLHTAPNEFAELRQAAGELGLSTLLAAMQIVDEALTRMRQSSHARTLLEMALIRVCLLEDLDLLSDALNRMAAGQPPAVLPARPASPLRLATAPESAAQKKTPELTAPSAAESAPPAKPTPEPRDQASRGDALPTSTGAANVVRQALDDAENGDAGGMASQAGGTVRVTSQNPEDVWRAVIGILEDLTADVARKYERVSSPAPDHLVVAFRAGYIWQKDTCERPERKAKIEEALRRVCGRPMRVEFVLVPEGPAEPAAPVVAPLRQRLREIEQHPLVQTAVRLFGAEVVSLDDASERKSSATG